MNDNLTCGLVRDLLPSYLEGLTGEETNEAVERHLSDCPRCTAALEDLRGGVREETRAAPREVEYLKKVRRSGKERVLLAVLITALLAVVGIAAKLFILGEPASRAGMSWTVSQEGDALKVHVLTTDSAMALCRWSTDIEDGVVRIRAKKVLPSVLYRSGEYWGRISLSGVRQVWLAEQLLWEDGMVISQQAADLMRLKTPYCGAPTALGNIARVLRIQEQLGSYTVSMDTARPPYRWTLAFDRNLSNEQQARMERYACVMLALVENLDEVAWTWPDGADLLFRDTAGRHLRELTEEHNLGPSGGNIWYSKDSVKDYAQSAADIQRMLTLLDMGA